MKNNSFFNSDIYKNVISGILSTLIIMWFIEPISDFIFPKILHFFENNFSSVADNIYRLISYGVPGISSSFDSAFLASSMFILLVIFCTVPEELVQTRIIKKREDEVITKDKVRLLRKLLCIVSFFAYFLVFYIAISQQYIYNTALKTVTNIEIVSPYLSDHEYKHLKSNFYSIASKADFDNVTQQIDAIAQDYSLRLRK